MDSSEKRRELMRNLSDLFIVGSEQFENHEAVLLEETFTELLFKLSFEEQAEVSERVADSEYLPESLAFKMGNAEPHIAVPIVERSPVLSVDSLVEIARTQSQDHLRALSMRCGIDEVVTDVIVERAETGVLGTLVKNKTASISEKSFSKIVDRATDCEDLKDALSRRPDIPESAIEKLVPMLSEDARVRLESLLAQDESRVSELFKRAESHVAETRLKKRAARIDAKALLRAIQQGETSAGDVMLRLCKEDRLLDIILILSRLGGIEESYGLNAFKQNKPEPFAMLCRSAGLFDTSVRALQTLRRRRLGPSARDIFPHWQGLTTEEADRVLRFTQATGKARGAQ